MTMPKRYKEKGIGYYTDEPWEDCKQEGFEHRALCQGCIEEGHKQGKPEEVLDCKMVFIDKDKKTLGQCCCYSETHGKRSGD